MTHLDLFSGIDGFALAAQWAGFETVAFSEIEPYACKILAKHWPKVPNLGDLRTADFGSVGPIDVLTGGFPCQPFSVAGKRKGKSDDRDLWPAMFGVIEKTMPAWIIGENVTGFIRMELARSIADLEGAGYDVQSFVIPACAVGAWHRRDRLWIVAHSRHLQGRARPIGNEAPQSEVAINREVSSDTKRVRKSQSEGSEQDKRRRTGNCCEEIPTNSASKRLSGQRMREASSDSAENQARQDDESINGRGPAIWLPEPAVGRVANGIPNRAHRLRGLGNAIVPQVAEVILKAIAEIITKTQLEPT